VPNRYFEKYKTNLLPLSSLYYPIPLNIEKKKNNVLWHKYKKRVYSTILCHKYMKIVYSQSLLIS